MIKTADINTLPSQEESLHQLQIFLNQSQSHHAYQMAFLRYIEICYDLNMYAIILEVAQKRLNDIKHLDPTVYDEKIIKVLIDASLAIEAFDTARYYIDYRKKFLPVMSSYLSLFDEIKYAKKMGIPYIDFLFQLEKENLESKQDIIFVLEEILSDFVKKDDYDQGLLYIEKLKSLDQGSRYLTLEYELLIKKASFETIRDKVLIEIEQGLEKPLHIGYLIHALIELGDLQRASDIEASYEAQFDTLDLNERKYVFEHIIRLYEALKHKLSLDLYKKKYNKVKRDLSKQPQSTEIEHETVVASDQREVVYLKSIEQKVENKKTNRHYYDALNQLLIYAFSFPSQTIFREKIRLLLIKAQSFMPFFEFVLYLENDNPNFFHFKKDRLYDKYLVPHLLLGTWIEDLISHKHELLFAPITSDKTNVVTQKAYEIELKTVFGYMVGSHAYVLIHFTETILDPGDYDDFLKGLMSIIEVIMSQDKQLLRLVNQASLFDDLFAKSNIPMRIMNRYQSHFNAPAMALLNTDSRTHYELFCHLVSPKDIHQYKNGVHYLLQDENRFANYEYLYDQTYIKELIYSRKQRGEVELVSFFMDLSPYIKKLESLDFIAYHDTETQTKNLAGFIESLPEMLNEKISFCLVELNTDLKSVYGTDLINKYFYEFVKITEDYFDDASIYIYQQNQLMIILPYNDIRRTTKDIKAYHKYIENYAPQTIKNLNFEIHTGILRYPVVTEEKNVSKLRKYFDISLDKAKNNKEFNYEFFVFSDYEREVIEDQLIHQLNDALDHLTLSLAFRQMIDLDKKTVWQYEAFLTFDNLDVDMKYLYTIAKKRKRLKALEFYLVTRVIQFLSKLEQATGKLIKLTIPITKETFLDKTFNTFLFETLKKYQIPSTFIRIKTDAILKSNRYALKIDELIMGGISLDTVDIKMNVMFNFHALHIDYEPNTKNFDLYIKHLLTLASALNISVIVRNVHDSQARTHLQTIGVKYIEGQLYKQLDEQSLFDKIVEVTK